MKSVLKLYDSATKKKREFVPLSAPKVKMYCCGPTVYDYLHIGNFRGAVFFNFVRNWLERLNYKVDYIYNFTDIDDKILSRSLFEKIKPKDLAEKYIKEFKKDYQSLKLKAHTANPRATETLPEIILLIQKLIDKGHAYQREGDVFYSVDSFKNYGSLSGRKTKELLTGARIKVDKKKKNPLDFALWKKSKPEENWHFDSPWGKGRPGWHIECSAMTYKFFGEEIDIHAGGSDLIFPHHENEIAQSTACSGKKYARFWLHNNMIVTEGDKMSKSLGNMISMRDFLNQYPGELFKFLILSCHYRSPLLFSKKSLRQALASLLKIYSSLAKAQNILSSFYKMQNILPSLSEQKIKYETAQALVQLEEIKSLEDFKKWIKLKKPAGLSPHPEKAYQTKWKSWEEFLSLNKQGASLKKFQKEMEQKEENMTSAFNDDFSTPKAFAVLFSLVSSFQKIIENKTMRPWEKALCAKKHLAFFEKYGSALALFQEEPHSFLNSLEDQLLDQKNLKREEIDDIIKKRSLARQNKDFKTADKLREKLFAMGIEVKDGQQTSKWEVKK